MPAQRRIMIIEDDPDIARMVDLNLRCEGFDVSVVHDGESGLSRLKAERHDLLLLDLMLPGIDGLSVCREVRRMTDYLPIIILTARSAEAHRVLGLELGADDYLTKPFSLPELCARVRAVLRRMDAARERAAQLAGVIQRGGVTIDPVAREVRLDGRPVALTTREFDLLLHFARHPGRVFNRVELLDQVWGYSHDGYEHTVNSHINRLRTKIEADPTRPARIITVWGIGYKYVDGSERR
jgi:DNA-binding response OmpR family regulator